MTQGAPGTTLDYHVFPCPNGKPEVGKNQKNHQNS